MKNQNLFIVVVLLLTLTNCREEAEIQSKDYPFVITNIPNIKNEGAEFSADLTKSGNQKILKYGFVWSEVFNPTIRENKIIFNGEPEKGTYSCYIDSGFVIGTTYYVRGYILTEKYEVYGNVKSFKSQGSIPPEILSFTPTQGYAFTKVYITGTNFGNNVKAVQVKFGDVTAKIDSLSDTSIRVLCPLIKKDDSINISVEVDHKTTISDEKYQVFYPWKRMADYPGQGIHSASYFSLIRKGYMIGGIEKATGSNPITKNKIWEFDPVSNTWTKKNDLPFDAESYPTCVVNNVGYIYNRDNNFFYKYIENTDSWQYETTFPGQSRSFSCFVVDNDIYAGSGGYNQFYKYNVNSREWMNRLFSPGTAMHYPISFSLNGNGYLALGEKSDRYSTIYYTEVWEYNVKLDYWFQRSNFPGNKRMMPLSFVLESKAYIGMGTVKNNVQGFPDFYEFTPGSDIADSTIVRPDQWVKIMESYPGGAAWNNVVFTIGNKAYIGTGAKSLKGGANWSIWESYRDLWEFDLNKK